MVFCKKCQKECGKNEKYKCDCGHYKSDHSGYYDAAGRIAAVSGYQVEKSSTPVSNATPVNKKPVVKSSTSSVAKTSKPKSSSTTTASKPNPKATADVAQVNIKTSSANTIVRKGCPDCDRKYVKNEKFCMFCGVPTIPDPVAVAPEKKVVVVKKKKPTPKKETPKVAEKVKTTTNNKPTPTPKPASAPKPTPAPSQSQPSPAKKSIFSGLFSKRDSSGQSTGSGKMKVSAGVRGTLKEGVMEKRAKNNRHLWQSRYFVITTEYLMYYKNFDDALHNKDPVKLLLKNIESVEVANTGKGSDKRLRMNVETGYRPLALITMSWEDTQEWAKYLRDGSELGERKQAEELANKVKDLEKQAALEKVRVESELRKQVEEEARATAKAQQAKLASAEKDLARKLAEKEALLQKEKSDIQAKTQALENELKNATTQSQEQKALTEAYLRREKEKEKINVTLDAERKRRMDNDTRIKNLREEGLRVAEELQKELNAECEDQMKEYREKRAAEAEAMRKLGEEQLKRREQKLSETIENEDELKEELEHLHDSFTSKAQLDEQERVEQEMAMRLKTQNQFDQEAMYVKREVEERVGAAYDDLIASEENLEQESAQAVAALEQKIAGMSENSASFEKVNFELQEAKALWDARVEYRTENLELLKSRRAVEENHKKQLQQMADKLQAEQDELTRLRREATKRKQEAQRSFTICLLGVEDPVGEIEIEKVGELTLEDLRTRITEELDDVPSSYIFVIKNIRVGHRQEAKKSLARLPHVPVYLHDESAPPAEEKPAVMAAPAPPPSAPNAPPSAPKVSITKSTAPKVERKSGVKSLMDSIRSGGHALKKVDVDPTAKKAAPEAGGLMGNLVTQLMRRRINIVEEGDSDDDMW